MWDGVVVSIMSLLKADMCRSIFRLVRHMTIFNDVTSYVNKGMHLVFVIFGALFHLFISLFSFLFKHLK